MARPSELPAQLVADNQEIRGRRAGLAGAWVGGAGSARRAQRLRWLAARLLKYVMAAGRLRKKN